MILKEDNYKEIINSYSQEDWKPLLELIPKIEKVKVFGDCTEAMKLLDKGIIDMNPYIEDEVVGEFRRIVYSISIIIDFAWVAWDEGRKYVGEENFDFDTIDVPTKCKLITAIVRNDRFCSGALVSAFESGQILKILKSIKKHI
jgi:hypothetical protein